MKWESVELIAERFHKRADGESRGLRIYLARAAAPANAGDAFSASANGVRVPRDNEPYGTGSRDAHLCTACSLKASMIDGGGRRLYRVIVRYSGGIRRGGGLDQVLDACGVGGRPPRPESMN